jgi:Alginate lyase
MHSAGFSFVRIAVLAGVLSHAQTTPRQAAATSPLPDARLGKLVLADGARLADVRKRATAEAPLATALDALDGDAKKALALKPMSVMDKANTPPSGDKHDYMSQAPYWWPDPAKPDGRPYIRRDGDRNPEINKITDRDNLGRVSTSVWTLGLAYYFTGRDEYAAHAARLTRTWFLDPATRMNPHLNFGQGIPGINDGRGIGIIETRDLVPMLDGIVLLTGSPHWTPADEAGLQAWMRAYLTWLVESPHGKDESKNGNNHETWYDVQVAGLALYTGQPDLARRTFERGKERIARQIEPDGRQLRELERTRAWDYSEFNLRAFFDLAAMGARHGVDLWTYRTADGRSLRGALDYMVQYAGSGQKWPYEQLGGVRGGVIHGLLRRAAVAWKEPAYAALAAKVGGGNPRLALLVP